MATRISTTRNWKRASRLLRSSLKRLQADILCLQEVHGQELPGHTAHDPKRNLSALDRVLEGTDYAGYERAFTRTSNDAPYNKRNLVILSRFPITQVQQYRNDHIDKLQYRKVTALPPEPEARDLRWERPILHAQIGGARTGPAAPDQSASEIPPGN